MAQTAVVLSRSKKSRKEIQSIIEQKLSVSLADYRSIVGEKKFESRIRKTARRFGQEIVEAIPKQKKSKKNPEAQDS